jgi:uncharacterized alkaline shock family protein YloU
MEGHASISPDVLARYAADAALEVDGVHALVEGHLTRHRPVRIVVGDDGRVTVELHLVLDWGASFGPVGTEVQTRVAEYLARMADLQPVRVDVIVDDVGPSGV